MRFWAWVSVGICLFGSSAEAASLTVKTLSDTPSSYATTSPTQQCLRGSVSLCGMQISVPDNLSIGATANLNLPAPYEGQSIAVACQSNGVSAFFQVLNPGAIGCDVPKCNDATLEICGRPVGVKGGTQAGGEIAVDLPFSSPLDSYASTPQRFTAQCVDANPPSYRLGDTSGISCNAFPCAAADIQLCGASIPIQGGARMGQVLNLTMPPPFAPDPFRVECVGSAGTAPAYQLLDHDAVSCSAAGPGL